MNYTKTLAPFRCSRYGRNWLRSKRSIDKLSDVPSTIRNTQRFRWRRLEGFVNAAKVVMRDIQRDRCNVVVQLLAKAVGQSREPALAHAQR